VHITPSLVFPRTAYIDNDRRVAAFFADAKVRKWVATHKEYAEEPIIHAYQQNYSGKLPEDIGTFDLLISQYAGFVSQDCKNYLRPGGLLLANNSHADAGLAHLDPDYELIAVMNHTREKWTISETNLQDYFVPKKGQHPPAAELRDTMKGVGYQKTAANYVFRRLRNE
jgi:hypothetical protein